MAGFRECVEVPVDQVNLCDKALAELRCIAQERREGGGRRDTARKHSAPIR